MDEANIPFAPQTSPLNEPKVPPRPSVTVIILTWNGLKYTKRCLETLISNTGFPRYAIVVADNGSKDRTLEYLQAHKGITLVSNGTNLGFAKGNNRAVLAADALSDIVLLNNDTEV